MVFVISFEYDRTIGNPIDDDNDVHIVHMFQSIYTQSGHYFTYLAILYVVVALHKQCAYAHGFIHPDSHSTVHPFAQTLADTHTHKHTHPHAEWERESKRCS